jgi:hypothetical protein
MRVMPYRWLLAAGAVLMFFCPLTRAVHQEGVPAGEGEVGLEAAAAAARQNQILRDFYRRLYPGLDGTVPPSEEFLENFVDRQIDAFAADIDRRLKRITDQAALVENLQERLGAVRGEGRETVEQSLKGVLRQLAEDCDGLADRLQLVFSGLNRRSRNRGRDSSSADGGNRDPNLELLSHIRVADRSIRAYLFTSRQVVRLEELEGEDMLMRLDAAEKLARELSR